MTVPPRTAGIVLLAFGALELAFVALFGLLFPLVGALIWATGLAPSDDDPMAIGITMIAAGLITAVIYAIPAIAALAGGLGLRREASWSRVAAIVAAALNCWVLPPFGIAVCVIVILAVASPPGPTG